MIDWRLITDKPFDASKARHFDWMDDAAATCLSCRHCETSIDAECRLAID